ncbi:hypothetical protein EVA_17981 [gut metagenome]|uniref:Uncharacterized protein n=1 Tax=gut metagenome TaxID=749906 RepID=J9C264_9ZZZZ
MQRYCFFSNLQIFSHFFLHNPRFLRLLFHIRCFFARSNSAGHIPKCSRCRAIRSALSA